MECNFHIPLPQFTFLWLWINSCALTWMTFRARKCNFKFLEIHMQQDPFRPFSFSFLFSYATSSQKRQNCRKRSWESLDLIHRWENWVSRGPGGCLKTQKFLRGPFFFFERELDQYSNAPKPAHIWSYISSSLNHMAIGYLLLFW